MGLAFRLQSSATRENEANRSSGANPAPGQCVTGVGGPWSHGPDLSKWLATDLYFLLCFPPAGWTCRIASDEYNEFA